MSTPFNLQEAAARLVADLMPIALVISGAGAAPFAAALADAGAQPDMFTPGSDANYDLAILLAAPGAAADPAQAAAITALAAATDRLLLVPTPLGEAGALNLDIWFELFAEQGFQPVVDYDAAFLGQGAFLVDRNATAAESELSAFAERLALGGALARSSQRVAVLEAELAEGGDRDRLKTALTTAQAELLAMAAREAAWRARAERAEADAAALRAQLSAWEVLGGWISATVQSRARGTLDALHAARGSVPARPSLWRRLRGRAANPDAQLLADAALIRACPLFDAPWYLAQRPQAAAAGADPVWHYVLFGAAEGISPGPWFDSAAYVARFPDAAGNPLLHAIRSGAAAEMVARS